MQDLRTLAIFVKVAERLSFVRAAADLGITQSGVSNAISRLEDQIGTRLLARTTRRVSLTEHGAAFFERCRQALAEIEEAELVLKDAQLKPSGNLRIDMPVSFGRLKVLPLLGLFQARHSSRAIARDGDQRYRDRGHVRRRTSRRCRPISAQRGSFIRSPRPRATGLTPSRQSLACGRHAHRLGTRAIQNEKPSLRAQTPLE